MTSYFHRHREEARISRLVPGINIGSRRTTTLVSIIAKTYFILTWSKVFKHKQFLPVHKLFVGRRDEKEDTKRKACHFCQRNFQILPFCALRISLLHLSTLAGEMGGETEIGEDVEAKSELPGTHTN